jgi:hypothetical protein
MAKTAMPALRESLRPRSAERELRPRHPSHKLTASIYCEVDGLPVDIEPLELSTAGLFVETPTPLPVDDEVQVFLRIGAMRFEAAGLVVQNVSCEQARNTRRKPGYGLLFMNVDDTARTQLRRGIQGLVVQRANPQHASATLSNSASNTASGTMPSMPARPPTAAAKPAATVVSPARPTTSVPNSSKPAAPNTNPSKPAAANANPSKPAAANANPSKPAAANATPSKPAAPSATAIDPREQTVLDKLRVEVRALDAKTPWGILGVSQGADLVEAKLAFFDASKRYHPHLFARYAAPEIKALVTQLFIAHKRAYDTLRKSGKPQRQSVVDQGLPAVVFSKQPGSGNR